jgi:putative ATPase
MPRSKGFQGGFHFEDRDVLPPDAPLAARMRPRTIDELAGQDAVTGPGSMLRKSIETGRLPSLILWGPPGCGKTTLARILANHVEAQFESVSAVGSGVADLRRVIEAARAQRVAGRRTVLFIDEIHRFNKAQQDVVLPHVEDGTVTLIGATTENPSFEVIAPLLSRVRVVRLQPLSDESLVLLVVRALGDTDRGLGTHELSIDDDAREALIGSAGGDGRTALNILELAAEMAMADQRTEIAASDVQQAVQDRRPYHDRAGDAHYDTVSALIKSLRGSDPDAALYWLARMLESGEDPLFIVRRMVILAAEDVGLADPNALSVAVACQQAVHFIGMPEAALPMAECAVYLALAPKSNSAYMGYLAAREAAVETSDAPVPMHLRNAPTGLMKAFGYGQGYRYAHNEPGHVARGEAYLPGEASSRAPFFEPGKLGSEGRLAEDWLRRREEQPFD